MIIKHQAERTFSRLFHGGLIRRLPKKHGDTQLILALAAASLDTQMVYREDEVDDLLIAWLEGFTCPIGMNHVTVRRHLVDHAFLLRNTSGSWYKSNQVVISKVVEFEARFIQPRSIFEKVQHSREERSRLHTTSVESTG